VLTAFPFGVPGEVPVTTVVANEIGRRERSGTTYGDDPVACVEEDERDPRSADAVAPYQRDRLVFPQAESAGPTTRTFLDGVLDFVFRAGGLVDAVVPLGSVAIVQNTQTGTDNVGRIDTDALIQGTTDGDGRAETWDDSTDEPTRRQERADEYALPTDTRNDTTDDNMSNGYNPRRDPRNWGGDTTNAPEEGSEYMTWPDTFVGVHDGTGGVTVPGNGPTESTNPGGDDTVNDWQDVRESVTPGDGSDPSGGMAVLAVLASALVAVAALVRGRSAAVVARRERRRHLCGRDRRPDGHRHHRDVRGQPGDAELWWSDDGNCWRLEVRGKNTKGGERTMRDAWMPDNLADDLRKFARERELSPSEAWVDTSTDSVRRRVREARESVAAESGDERWRSVSAHDLRRS